MSTVYANVRPGTVLVLLHNTHESGHHPATEGLGLMVLQRDYEESWRPAYSFLVQPFVDVGCVEELLEICRLYCIQIRELILRCCGTGEQAEAQGS